MHTIQFHVNEKNKLNFQLRLHNGMKFSLIHLLVALRQLFKFRRMKNQKHLTFLTFSLNMTLFGTFSRLILLCMSLLFHIFCQSKAVMLKHCYGPQYEDGRACPSFDGPFIFQTVFENKLKIDFIGISPRHFQGFNGNYAKIM